MVDISDTDEKEQMILISDNHVITNNRKIQLSYLLMN